MKHFKRILVVMSLMAATVIQVKGQTTLVLQPGPADGQDTEVRTDMPDTPCGWLPYVSALAWTVGGNPFTDRGLLRFDLSSVPPGANILSATLSLYCDPNSTYYQLQSGENESLLMRVTQPWDEDQVTWNTQPGTTPADAITLPTSAYNTQSYPNIDVTNHVKDMVLHPESAFGWMLKLVSEELYHSMTFASSNNADAGLRPKLTIVLECGMPVARYGYQVRDQQVTFSDSSQSASEWSWDFGDGYQSTLQNPIHTYALQGKYFVCLTARNSCGLNIFCDTVYACRDPEPVFTYDIPGNMTIAFRDSSYAPLSWYWDFGDGFFSDLKDPVHTYNSAGTYFVCETAANSCKTQTFCDSVVVKTAGIGEMSMNRRLLIYPNPASDRISIAIYSGAKQKVILTIYNEPGIMVASREVSLSAGINTIRHDLDGLSKGLYFVRLNENSTSESASFIVR